jgi:hypothetical protein
MAKNCGSTAYLWSEISMVYCLRHPSAELTFGRSGQRMHLILLWKCEGWLPLKGQSENLNKSLRFIVCIGLTEALIVLAASQFFVSLSLDANLTKNWWNAHVIALIPEQGLELLASWHHLPVDQSHSFTTTYSPGNNENKFLPFKSIIFKKMFTTFCFIWILLRTMGVDVEFLCGYK